MREAKTRVNTYKCNVTKPTTDLALEPLESISKGIHILCPICSKCQTILTDGLSQSIILILNLSTNISPRLFPRTPYCKLSPNFAHVAGIDRQEGFPIIHAYTPLIFNCSTKNIREKYRSMQTKRISKFRTSCMLMSKPGRKLKRLL